MFTDLQYLALHKIEIQVGEVRYRLYKTCKLVSPVDQQILCAHSMEISRSWKQGKQHTVNRKYTYSTPRVK